MTYIFDDDTSCTGIAEGMFALQISERWSVFGYPNGGYVMAAMLRPLVAASRRPDPLTATAHFVRPTMPGPATVSIDVFSVGKRHVHVQASLMQERERVRMIAACGDLAAATGPSAAHLEPPVLPAPEKCLRARSLPTELRDASVLFDAIETRVPSAGEWLCSSGDAPTVVRWMRFADGRPPDVASLPLFIDPFPPAAYAISAGGWLPTIEMTVHVRNRPASGWLRGRFTTRIVQDGYVEEDGELWDAEDRLVAQSRQLLTVLPPGQQAGPNGADKSQHITTPCTPSDPGGSRCSKESHGVARR